MGISGLLPELKKSENKTNLKCFRNCSAAVDASSWLHKGAYGCADKLVLDLPTNKYVEYCVKKVKLLLEFNINPILVFDGMSLPIKEEENLKRAKIRVEAKEKAKKLLKSKGYGEAMKYFQRAISITPEMVYSLIKQLKELKISYVVAPYEADAQMAFLSLNNFVDIVITEDSDLLVYGCKRVLFKLQDNGNCIEIKWEDIKKSNIIKPEILNQDTFQTLCILCGCDYIKNIPGIGIKTAAKLVNAFQSNILLIIKELEKKGANIPFNFKEYFRLAFYAFRHQAVWHPMQEKMVRLTPAPLNIKQNIIDQVGKILDDDISRLICMGEYNTQTLLPYTEKDFTLNKFSCNLVEPKTETKEKIFEDRNGSIQDNCKNSEFVRTEGKSIFDANTLCNNDNITNSVTKIVNNNMCNFNHNEDSKKIIFIGSSQKATTSIFTSSLTTNLSLAKHIPLISTASIFKNTMEEEKLLKPIQLNSTAKCKFPFKLPKQNIDINLSNEKKSFADQNINYMNCNKLRDDECYINSNKKIDIFDTKNSSLDRKFPKEITTCNSVLESCFSSSSLFSSTLSPILSVTKGEQKFGYNQKRKKRKEVINNPNKLEILNFYCNKAEKNFYDLNNKIFHKVGSNLEKEINSTNNCHDLIVNEVEDKICYRDEQDVQKINLTKINKNNKIDHNNDADENRVFCCSKDNSDTYFKKDKQVKEKNYSSKKRSRVKCNMKDNKKNANEKKKRISTKIVSKKSNITKKNTKSNKHKTSLIKTK